MSNRTLMLWGFQGTVDYIVSLDADGFARIGLKPPAGDAELFVSHREISQLRDALEEMGFKAACSPGGSPLVSALAAASWAAGHKDSGTTSCFVGRAPLGLMDLIPDDIVPVLRYAELAEQVYPTLALEYRAASAKLMFSTSEGRWLDESLACAALAGIQRAVEEHPGYSVALGFGGLNKSRPAVAGELIRTLRKSVPRLLLFVSGNSFARAPDRALSFWPDLYRVLADADVVSLSREELAQLSAQWGENWARDIAALRGVRAVVVHWPGGAEVVASSLTVEGQAELEVLNLRAGKTATAYAELALTGLGARFDGVLSALIAEAWLP
jgi:hypothetical protein